MRGSRVRQSRIWDAARIQGLGSRIRGNDRKKGFKMRSLTELYHQRIVQGFMLEDPEQAKTVALLQDIANQLQKKRFFWQGSPRVKGLYVWGKVGRGKTYLMDLFFESLRIKEKKRVHFHRFMMEVHAALNEVKGRADPLGLIAKKIAKNVRVLCFDEFVVEDIADAMILANLFKALFAQGVTLIATSNTEPDHLYLNGLQRDLFLPCIKLLKDHMHIINLVHPHDYRRRVLLEKGVYFIPLNRQAQHNLQQAFKLYAKEPIEQALMITVDGRSIHCIAKAENAIWFEFEAICNVPRSKRDYLYLVEQYEVFCISNLPQLRSEQDNEVCNFIALVDVLYDARKKLLLSAAVRIDDLYPAGRFKTEFQRTMSRLIEMQSLAYLQDYNEL